ncbi:unnamed protein product [Rotaria sp. Silwood1]|nr:unnamed protein product [Rotaria sp. Silwood1]CAF1430033.1 unnamed protein product [Rotaria sp. Silwood1]CAF3572407.1 unnamed protein product [Rotaria sp. Silwood1]CAF3576407.1 unnamed protein product [Rotaria sp. Silwood1]CAF4565050.1 unnamed protein product [Rotaria sp. Silwood1]
MTSFTCEETSSCSNFQSAICLHCNRRLCLQHITEHNKIIPSSMQNLSHELEATFQQLNDKYEKSRNTYNDLLTLLKQWRTQETEKIEQIYKNKLQWIESQQETLNMLHQELIEVLDRSARQQLVLIQPHQDAIMKRLHHIHSTIKNVQQHSTQLKWNFSKLPSPMNLGHSLQNSSSMQVPLKIPKSNIHELPRKRKFSTNSSSGNAINLRKYRSFRRLVDMFANISCIEQSKNDIANYLKQQGPHFQFPILVCSYLTAWHRKSEINDKTILLNEHISTIKKHIENRHSDDVVLLGIHAFFFNETIQENKREMMTFLLQYVVNHQCISPNEILNWYENTDLYDYPDFVDAKQLITSVIKSFRTNNTVTNVQPISVNQNPVQQSDTIEITQEPAALT